MAYICIYVNTYCITLNSGPGVMSFQQVLTLATKQDLQLDESSISSEFKVF